MIASSPITAATWSQRLRHLLLNLLVFSLCYQTANWMAESNHIQRNIAFNFETQTPFIAWMIIPYLSSGLFFIGSFFYVTSFGDLRVLSHRIVLATVIATLIFMVYPLQFSLLKPMINTPLYATLFQFLSIADRPYNQFPSLHIAYCVIFWQSLHPNLRQRPARIALAMILLLIAASTLFTYQHHCLDIVGGLLLGLSTLQLIRSDSRQTSVAFYYFIAATIVVLIGSLALTYWFALYISFSLLLVGWAYHRHNRHFLHKKAGQHPLWIWLLFAPYLAGYWITWKLVQYKERQHPAFTQFSQQLWIGRRLTPHEAKQLPSDCVVFDLSPELSEASCLSKQHYWHFPILDLIHPPTQLIAEIAASIHHEIALGRVVYLHCAMGYSRCKLVANHVFSETKAIQ
ncbi:phosphatase PAP2 family protein [Solimicrobium silvestre]|uniref:PAP2 superfamily n=1 Tax=Solimicrobium silvestre TaxID=2099400 RepID=A0A2S9H152_9BURK|nr:phosphatase PAP2 family protein [Solimicrobium silvestre]PRC93673.1 PAP2 superfamily [Solimicrobium silvestre]